MAGPGLPRAPPSPVPVTPNPVRDRPTPRAEPPVRLGVGWRGGGVAVAAPPGGPPARPSPSRRRPWAGSPPVGRGSSAPCPTPPRRAPLLPVSRAPGPRLPPSSVRLSLALSLSFAPSLPVAPPARARHPLPVEAPLTPSVATRGAPGTRARAGLGPRGPGVWGSGAERAASGRERGEGLRPVSGTRVWGRRRAVAVVSRVAVGPAPRPGSRVTGR